LALPVPEDPVEEPPKSVGRYRLVQRIGRGAMGEVYRAEDPVEGIDVAIKLMAAETLGDNELIERFRREAFSAAALDHPNITRIHDFGEEGGTLYMAMELLEGSDLKHIIEAGAPGDVREKLEVMLQIASAMAFVHARGLVHRDLKPGNIHVNVDGQVKIMDFGLVRLADSNMTRTGMVMGSPSYMAPELIRGNKADARSDIYALGCVFYEFLSGKRAFGGKGLTQILMAIMSTEPESLGIAAPAVPGPVARLVERCLTKDPEKRYQTGGELHAALEVAHNVFAT
jgi:serine/threonine protein kinase